MDFALQRDESVIKVVEVSILQRQVLKLRLGRIKLARMQIMDIINLSK